MEHMKEQTTHISMKMNTQEYIIIEKKLKQFTKLVVPTVFVYEPEVSPRLLFRHSLVAHALRTQPHTSEQEQKHKKAQ